MNSIIEISWNSVRYFFSSTTGKYWKMVFVAGTGWVKEKSNRDEFQAAADARAVLENK